MAIASHDKRDRTVELQGVGFRVDSVCGPLQVADGHAATTPQQSSASSVRKFRPSATLLGGYQNG